MNIYNNKCCGICNGKDFNIIADNNTIRFNCYGYDKVSLEERVEWAKLHNWAIVEVGTAPLINKWWMEADKPWQFLRACIEYVKFKCRPIF